MNSTTSRKRGSRTSNVAALLGSASFVALGSGAAQAQVAEVLITGSLIAGTQAVGVPITAVGEEQFLEQGAVTVADMLLSVPSVSVDASLTSLRGGGSTGYGQNVAIHGFEGSGGDAITLMLINGRRWPIQGHGGDTVDPSIIPQLAVERVDILTAGASAVYGADAIVGVLNVILKRNFEGAVSQVNYSQPVHIGQGMKIAASHLHGISWDTGNVTLTGEAYFQQRVKASAVGRDKYTTNFSDFLGFDVTPTALQMPGVVSFGELQAPVSDATSGTTPGGVLTANPHYSANAPNGTPDGFSANVGTRFCVNCYALPKGIGSPYIGDNLITPALWSAVGNDPFIVGSRNEQNQRINYDDSDALPQQTREAFVGTLNQVLTDDFFGMGQVELHGTMFYSNRKGQMHFGINTNSGNSREHASFRRSGGGVEIDRSNPYIPTGLLAALDAHGQEVSNYTFQQELDDFYNDAEEASLDGGGTAEDAAAAGAAARADADNIADAQDAADDAADDASELRMSINATPLLGTPGRISFENIATRYEFGFNFNSLPFDWVGDAFYSMSNEENVTRTTNMLNRDRSYVALGNTQKARGLFAAYTKPEAVPFLNLFCDGLAHGVACNSQNTLDYIRASRLQQNQWRIRQMGLNFSGPVFELPSGEVQAAVGFEHLSQHFFVLNDSDHGSAPGNAGRELELEIATRVSHAFFTQLNIPVLGGEWSIPGFIEGLDLELGYRVDKFDFQEAYIKTPKVAATLFLGQGLTVRGAWGKSFRAPGFSQASVSSGSRSIGANELGGGGSNDFQFSCNNATTGQASGVALPGSATAILNPTCLTGQGNEAYFAPAGILLQGGSGLADPARGLSQALRPGGPSKGLAPEDAVQYVFGANFAPTDGWFSGLNLDISYFNIKINGTIRADGSGDSAGVYIGDNPIARHLFIVKPGYDALGTGSAAPGELAVWNQMVAFWGGLAGSTTTWDRGDAEDMVFVFDGNNANVGFIQFTGIDFQARYDWDMGDLGSFNIGTSGYYELDQTQQANDTSPIVSPYGFTDLDGEEVGQNSGAHLQHVRSRLGWTNGTWTTTLFNTLRPHTPPTTNLNLPDCFWKASLGYGGGDCYTASPFFPQQHDQFYNGSPGWMQWDINVTYNTGMLPQNEYLQNVNISLTVNNFLNANPPQVFNSRSRGREIFAFDSRFSEMGRFASLTLTKTW